MDDPTRMTELDDAFAGLYLRARRVTFGILGDLRTAEDAASEALVRALGQWHRVRCLPHRDAWVLRLATDVAVGVARRRDDAAPTPTDAATDDGDDLIALDPALVDALVRLPRRPREALVLVQLARCSEADTAAVMDVSVSAVDRYVRRAVDLLGGPLPPPASVAGDRPVPSFDDEQAFVLREARRRELRRSVGLGAGAVGVGVLVLAVLAVGIIRADPPVEISAGGGSAFATPGSIAAPIRPIAVAGADTPSPEEREPPGSPTAVEADPTTAAPAATATTRRRAPVGAKPANAPGAPTTTTGADEPADPAGPNGATRAPAPPEATGPASTTGTTTTTTTPRSCTNEDLAATDITWASVRSGQSYPDHTAPAGEPTWFGLSVWPSGDTPCLTPDRRQELTVTDAPGTVVYRFVLDDGPGRLTEPGHWLLFDGRIDWDPACVEAPPASGTTVVCDPVGPGTYSAQLYVAGATLPPLSVTIVGR